MEDRVKMMFDEIVEQGKKERESVAERDKALAERGVTVNSLLDRFDALPPKWQGFTEGLLSLIDSNRIGFFRLIGRATALAHVDPAEAVKILECADGALSLVAALQIG